MKAQWKKPRSGVRKTRAAAKLYAAQMAAKKPRAVALMVKRMVTGQLEKKFVSSATNSANFNSSISTINDLKAFVPQISTGTGSWQRLDQRITPLRLTTNWHFAFSDAITRSMNILVTMYCFTKKNIKYVPDMLLDVTTNGIQLLAAGNSGIVQPFNGYVTESDLPFNKDSYTLIKKYQFQLCNNVGFPNGDTTAGNAPNVSPAASHKHISLSIKCPKQLCYKPGSVVYPDGFAPFWAVGYAHIGGQAPDAVNTDLNVSWNTMLTYTDA